MLVLYYIIMDTTKRCTRCLETKSITDFYFIKTRNRYHSHCKECAKLEVRRQSPRPNRLRINGKYYTAVSRARRRGYVFTLTKDEYNVIISNEYCFYCGDTPEKKTLDRVDNSLGYIKGNCVMSCLRCNLIKGSVSISICRQVIEFVTKNREAPGGTSSAEKSTPE